MLLALALSAVLGGCNAPDHLCAVPLNKGERAPFSGQMLTAELAAKLALGVNEQRRAKDFAEKKCAEDAAVDKSLCAMVQKSQLAEFLSSQKRCNEVVFECQAALRQMEPPWYKSSWFTAPVAAILAGGAVAWALHH